MKKTFNPLFLCVISVPKQVPRPMKMKPEMTNFGI
jgi:hypothetical protein